MLKWSNILDANAQGEHLKIFQTVNDFFIVAITDSTGSINYVNDKFCEISQYSKEELIGQNHRILKSGHHTDLFYKELWGTITSGKIWTGEVKNRAKDGSFYWVFTTIAPYITEDNCIQYVSIRYPITEKKILEEKVNRLRVDLDKAMIEQDTREKFLSTMAHDLRTPLTIAKISAKIIEKKYVTSDGGIRTLLNKIDENINRVDTLITGLLDASRNRGHLQNLPLDFGEFSVFNIVNLAQKTINNFIDIHGDKFLLEGREEIIGNWSFLAIRRILENLITNAVKYGDNSSPIKIKIDEFDQHVIITIHNWGQPISVDDQKTIFDYFQRSSKAEISGQKGWGLGLSTVKGLAELHGGSVGVCSSNDEGTSFSVTLPKDSKDLTLAKMVKNKNLISENENFLRLFRHMPEILCMVAGPKHTFEFVNEAFIETFGTAFDNELPQILNNLEILNEVYSTGIPRKLKRSPLNIAGKTRYFNHTWVPRKNSSGKIIGVLSISSEVIQDSNDSL